MRHLITVAAVLLLIITNLLTHIISYQAGVNSQMPKSKEGYYRVEIIEGGRVVITTKIQYIDMDEDKGGLIVYGEPRH